jgi:hypothetical protein
MNGANPDQVVLRENDIPALRDGIYRLVLTETVKVPAKKNEPTPEPTPEIIHAFTVRGPQFKLAPQEIASFYPPSGSRGEYSNVLPHIALARSSLPWERLPCAGSNKWPWLAVVLVHEDDCAKAKSRSRTLGNLLKPTDPDDSDVHFPLLEADGDKADWTVQVLDVDEEFAGTLLPTWSELKTCAHVRKGADGWQAFVVAHPRQRPRPGLTRVYLVSLENWYDREKPLSMPAGKKKRRFVSLLEWRFVSDPETDAKRSFRTLSESLNRGPLRMPESKSDNKHAEYLRNIGGVALPALSRSGLTRPAIYHGPLVPHSGAKSSPAEDDIKLRPPRAKIFDFEDVSYRAARELGRLMLLHDPAASRQLYNWKAEQEQRAWKPSEADDLPFDREPEHYPFPSAWFERLISLEGVPFCYLVPRRDMLKPESVRSFEIEAKWVQELIDGALSLVWAGKIDKRNVKLRDVLTGKRKDLHGQIRPRRGLLIRSALISDWPDLHEDCEDGAGKKVTLTKRKLSSDVALYLLDGDPKTITLSVPAEHLHFEWQPPALPGGADPATVADFVARFTAKKVNQKFNLISAPAGGR